MEMKELMTKTPKELQEELRTLQEKQIRLRFQMQAGQHKKTSDMKVLRKNIARITMVLAQKLAQKS